MDIVVALGGGGAKGNAHIGVLRRLEKEGYHIRAVAGTSAGGLIAALYAAGYSPDEIEAIYGKVDQTKLYARRPNEGPALLGLAGVDQWLDEVVGERTFAGLRIPCALTAVDINSTCEVILQKGRLKDAMLATIALPGIFPPHRVDGHELVDGGVLDPVPVSVACSLAPDLPVVAVVLSSPVGPTTSYQLPVSLPGVIPDSIVKRLTRMRITQAFNIFLHSVEIGNRLMAELRLEAEDPDVIVRPDVKHINLLDRVDVHEVARLGEEAVEKVLPDLKRAVAWHSRLRRRLFGRGRA